MEVLQYKYIRIDVVIELENKSTSSSELQVQELKMGFVLYNTHPKGKNNGGRERGQESLPIFSF